MTIFALLISLSIITKVYATIDPDPFFYQVAISQLALSPDGSKIAYIKFNDVYIKIIGGKTFKAVGIKSNYTYTSLEWIGNNTISTSYYRIDGNQFSNMYFVAYGLEEENGEYQVKQGEHTEINGYIVDPLLGEDNAMLFARAKYTKKYIYFTLHKVNPYEDLGREVRDLFDFEGKTNKKIRYFVRDLDGIQKIDFGAGIVNGKPTLWRKKRAKWSLEFELDEEAHFQPLAYSSKLNKLWALSNFKRDKISAVEIDLITKKTKLLYQNSQYDVSNILFFKGGTQPKGVTYISEGKLRYAKLESSDQDYELVRALLKDENLVWVDGSVEHQRYIVYAVSASQPGAYYFCNLKIRVCELIDKEMPWLDGISMGQTELIKFKNSEGSLVEAFLTRPSSSNESIPLVVMPHGGPIGVGDVDYYNPHVQWLSFNGYAVLRVNYRGSSGYGTAFQAQGMREFGRGIEDDIDKALDLSLQKYSDLDRNRVAIYGSSYGGYSALMSVIRSPEKYRCAGSFAGVMDLPLLFHNTTIAHNLEITDYLKQMVGDPVSKYHELIAYSPVYQYEKIQRPIFIAHGDADAVVDMEHSIRMVKMLSLANKPYVQLWMKGTRHGFIKIDEVNKFYKSFMPFLDKCLDASLDI